MRIRARFRSDMPTPEGRPGTRKNTIHPPIQVGKYLVTPLTQRTHDGRFRAAVSIRSGRGSASHDRVMRFTPSFDSDLDASQYARVEGLAWLNVSAPTAASPAINPW